MKRQLRPNYPTNFLFFDTETRPVKKKKDVENAYHTLWFGHNYAFRREGSKRTREVNNVFSTIDAFWKFLFTRLDTSRPLYVFAHNIGFDLTIVDFWERCESIPISIELPVIDDPPTFFVTEIKRCKVYFVDTFNFWRESLKDLGSSVGMEKGTMPSSRDDMQSWYDYCKQDVHILAKCIEGLIDFLQIHDLGSFKLSTPSIAMSTFKYRFMPERSIYVHDNLKVLEMERAAYHGGLVHCFFIGKIRESVYKLDVNSLYPSCMLESMPVKYLGHWKNISVKRMSDLLQGYIGCADVQISSKERTYPYYDGTRLIEGRGCFRCSLCGPELHDAIRSGDISRCYHFARYATGVIFREYVEYFYALRLQYKSDGNKVGDKLSKILMNSLYGKFGQRSHDWVKLTPEILSQLYIEKKIKPLEKYQSMDGLPRLPYGTTKWFPQDYPESLTIRNVGGHMEVQIDAGEHWESCPIIAAHICALARKRLRDLIGKAGKRNVYYCDTDSLFLNSAGYSRLKRIGEIDPSTIGKLKLEGISEDTDIRCPKDYRFDGNVIIKGVRKDAIAIGDDEYVQNQFEGIRSILKRGGKPYVKIGWCVKKISRQYHKGIVGKDGWVDFITLNQDA